MSIDVRVRRAVLSDLPFVVALFKLPNEGNKLDLDGDRDPFDAVYVEALASMNDDNALYVADLSGVGVIGVFQLTFIRHVGYQGGLVAQIENVVVDRAYRSRGVGEKHHAMGNATWLRLFPHHVVARSYSGRFAVT